MKLKYISYFFSIAKGIDPPPKIFSDRRSGNLEHLFLKPQLWFFLYFWHWLYIIICIRFNFFKIKDSSSSYWRYNVLKIPENIFRTRWLENVTNLILTSFDFFSNSGSDGTWLSGWNWTSLLYFQYARMISYILTLFGIREPENLAGFMMLTILDFSLFFLQRIIHGYLNRVELICIFSIWNRG